MRVVAWWVAVVGLVACGGKSDTGHEDEDPAEHACELASDAGISVSAGADAASAAAVSVAEEPVTVDLVDDGSGVHVGFLEVTVAEETDATLFAGTADVVSGLWLDGVEQPLATPGPNSFCPDEIPEHWDLELTPGTWTIELGPVAVDRVWLMLVSSAGHAHEE